jgi:hypothetical protein
MMAGDRVARRSSAHTISVGSVNDSSIFDRRIGSPRDAARSARAPAACGGYRADELSRARYFIRAGPHGVRATSRRRHSAHNGVGAFAGDHHDIAVADTYV